MRAAIALFIAGLLLLAWAGDALAASPPSGDRQTGNRVQAGFTIEQDEPAALAPRQVVGPEEETPGRTMDLPAFVAPLSQNGHLNGYAFVHVRVHIREGVNLFQVRAQAHFALDRLVRASHAHNLTDESGRALDIARARDVWLETLREYYGPRPVENISVSASDTRMLRH